MPRVTKRSPKIGFRCARMAVYTRKSRDFGTYKARYRTSDDWIACGSVGKYVDCDLRSRRFGRVVNGG